MRGQLPLPIFLTVVLASTIAAPARVSAQTAHAAPAIEIGPLINEFVGVTDGLSPSSLIGARASAWVTSRVSVQVDLRFIAKAPTDGLYGLRLRYMPRGDSSSWYLFGGSGGTFQLPDVRSYPARGRVPAGSYERPGGIRNPVLPHGGAGWRFVGPGRWSASIEGEVWTSLEGGAAVGTTFDVSYRRGHVGPR